MRILFPLSLVLCSLAASAQLYSWKDANGKIHYSDQPPADKTQTRKVAPASAPPIPPPAAPVSKSAKDAAAAPKKDKDTVEKEAKEAAAKEEKDKADAEVRLGNCKRSKAYLTSVESGVNRFITNSAGERVALDGAVRDNELASARKAVDEWCK